MPVLFCLWLIVYCLIVLPVMAFVHAEQGLMIVVCLVGSGVTFIADLLLAAFGYEG